MIPYSRPKLPDLYTLSQSKLIENHTFHSGTYLYIPYMVVPPPRQVSYQNLKFQIIKRTKNQQRATFLKSLEM